MKLVTSFVRKYALTFTLQLRNMVLQYVVNSFRILQSIALAEKTITFDYVEDVEVLGITGYRFELVTAAQNTPITGFFILLQNTGIPLDVAARLQINMLLQENSRFTMYNYVPTVFFPMLWFEERATVSPEIAADLRLLLMLPIMGLYCSLGLVLLGIIILALHFLPRFLRSDNWTVPRRSKRNATDNKPSQIIFSRECIRPLMTCPESMSSTPEEGSPFTKSRSPDVCVK
ncbi:hypothetical protein Cfor_05707 [Coptotermes formosanus]|uniref:Uncharacterized protein n=1 Tax=Coptotermes formosanus TaxID=36987 RepID=A0A6L2Q4B9_COPFO|nr:hypothetical protein Cfor_05707 [Coptotermes formosanus]